MPRFNPPSSHLLTSPLARFLLHRVTRNILFWLVYAVLPVYLNWGNFGSDANLYTDLLYYATLAVLGYVNNLLLIPWLMDRGRPVAYFVAAGTLLLVVAYVEMFWLVPLLSDYLDSVGNYLVTYWYNLGNYLFFMGTFTGAALLSRLATAHRRTRELENLQAETELAFLRAQVNPHLLFNTLNMLYSHAVEGSARVPEMMLALSDSLRYAVRAADLDRVLLYHEINYLRDYVELQQLRLEDRAVVDFTDEVGPQSQEMTVAPLLLIVPVENAFKYATASLVEGIRIAISLRLEADVLVFTVVNNTDPENTGPAVPGMQVAIPGEQTGLANLHRRLELIYGNDASFRTKVTNGTFTAVLRLPLTAE